MKLHQICRDRTIIDAPKYVVDFRSVAPFHKKLSYRKETARLLHNIEMRVLH